ncbi:MAG: aminotransferase class V-fold PLP-dependent enzyme [Bdellovibrionales bacterium]|nr:aminotransferase class V-fold PLP-dependent enzyme [Bdellovibrionales bacterium]
MKNRFKDNFLAAQKSTYLFSAAVSPLHRRVYEKRLKHLDMMFTQGDIHWHHSIEEMEVTRHRVAELFNAKNEDIAFGSNTSMNMNLLAMMYKQKGEGYNVVIPEDEFPSSSLPWYHHGFEVRRVASQKSFISIEDILNLCDEKTLAVAHSHVQFATGFRQDLQELGSQLKKRQIDLIVNATQSIGVFPIDVERYNITALVASGHKWLCMGYGLSVAYMNLNLRNRFKAPVCGWLSVENMSNMSSYPSPLKSTASVLETGVPPFHILTGLSTALEVVKEEGIENIAQQILSTRRYLIQELQKIDLSLISYDDTKDDVYSSHNSGNILIQVQGFKETPEQILEKLAEDHIYVSLRNGGLRIAIHYFNDCSDVDRLVEKLSLLLN